MPVLVRPQSVLPPPRVFLLHNHSGRLFTAFANQRASILAFSEEEHAKSVAAAIERVWHETGQWPRLLLDEDVDLIATPQPGGDLAHVEVAEWTREVRSTIPGASNGERP